MTGARAAGPSRRHLLLGGAAGLATAGSLGGCAAERAPDAGATGRDAAVERVTARRRFRGRHQPGLDDQPQPHAAFVSCTLAQPFDRDSLARLLRILTDDIERLMDGRGPLTEQEPEMASRTAALTITVGIGPALVAAAGQPVPQWLTGLPGFAVDRLEPRWNGGDLLLQICADSPVTVAHAQRRLLAGLRSLGGPAWVQRGFREPFEGPGTPMRNLFGQIDGTVQPEVRGSERDLLWVGEDGPEWLRDGTTMVIRRIRMDLDTWDAVDRVGRENAIGRTLDTGAPLSAPRASATETSDLAAKDTEWADVCRGVVTEADLQLALVAGDEDAVVRGRDGRHPLVGVSGVVLEHLGEAVGDACVDPEPPHLGVPCDAGAGSGDEGVVTVEGHAAGGLRGEGCEETRGVKRSSWSRATLSRSAWVGRTTAVKRRAWASSSSRTAMSARARPERGRSRSREEMTPLVKLLPVGLVRTVRPWARSSATSIFVVVVLPLVPETMTMPPRTSARACARKAGSTRSTTRPGIADPPPPLNRAAIRAALPAMTAAVVL